MPKAELNKLSFDYVHEINLNDIERLWLVNLSVKKEQQDKFNEKFPNAKIIFNDPMGSTGSGWRTHERYYDMIDMFNKRNYIAESFTKYDK